MLGRCTGAWLLLTRNNSPITRVRMWTNEQTLRNYWINNHKLHFFIYRRQVSKFSLMMTFSVITCCNLWLTFSRFNLFKIKDDPISKLRSCVETSAEIRSIQSQASLSTANKKIEKGFITSKVSFRWTRFRWTTYFVTITMKYMYEERPAVPVIVSNCEAGRALSIEKYTKTLENMKWYFRSNCYTYYTMMDRMKVIHHLKLHVLKEHTPRTTNVKI